ncbi:MAG: hypothetical protein H6993_07690 [Pseudomonadales bacterium]|nr:hypothetical protein [Pseudomonadales bacterium]MCP5183829.1 hypothetical protein [Pseudomonadales bacterium]
MTRPPPALACATLLLLGSAGHADEVTLNDLGGYVSPAWHTVEIVVFDRPGTPDTVDGRPQAVSAPRRYGRDLLQLQPVDGYQAPVLLDAQTRDCLEHPPEPRRAAGARDNAVAAPDSAPSPAAPLPEPDAEELLVAASARWEESLRASRYTEAPPESWRLTAAADRLGTQAGARILAHLRWHQELPPPQRSQPLLIQAGGNAGELRELEGTVTVGKDDNILVRATFWLHGPHIGAKPRPLAVSAQGNYGESPWEPLSLGNYLALSEARYLLPGEVNYLDHPRLGVLVVVEPVAVPAELAALFETAKAARKQQR